MNMIHPIFIVHYHGNADRFLGYGVHSLALVADSFHMVRSTCLSNRGFLMADLPSI